MLDADLVAKNLEFGAGLASSRWRLPFVKQNWDLFGVFLLVLATFPMSLLAPRSLVVVSDPNLLDDSWILDISFKACRGIWLGRNVAFTYGPVYQWLSSAPARYS